MLGNLHVRFGVGAGVQLPRPHHQGTRPPLAPPWQGGKGPSPPFQGGARGGRASWEPGGSAILGRPNSGKELSARKGRPTAPWGASFQADRHLREAGPSRSKVHAMGELHGPLAPRSCNAWSLASIWRRTSTQQFR